MMKLRLLQLLIIAAMLGIGFSAGRLSERGYESGYEQALEDIASGEVSIDSASIRAAREKDREFVREVEYQRIVSRVAEAYRKDPSEIEVECGLTDAHGNILRGERITEDDPRWDCHTMGNKICGPLN